MPLMISIAAAGHHDPLVSRQRSPEEDSEDGCRCERRTRITFDECPDVRHHALGIVTAYVVSAGGESIGCRVRKITDGITSG